MGQKNFSKPEYGVIDRYLGTRGKEYFDAQCEYGAKRAPKFNSFIWKSYVTKDDILLDFGCGPGFLLKTLQAKQKVGVEINPSSREFANKLGGITVVENTHSLDDGTFTKVISGHALEHIPNPHSALLELRRIIRDDGKLVLLVPMEDWRKTSSKQFDQNDWDMHLYTWTPKLLGNLLWVSGFRPIEIKVITHCWPPSKIADYLWEASHTIFHLAAKITATLRKMRQILLVAEPRKV